MGMTVYLISSISTVQCFGRSTDPGAAFPASSCILCSLTVSPPPPPSPPPSAASNFNTPPNL
ncbi:hypothetical protein D8674_020917 [Pyrus ussuriensis x Pyrus communis]|uniref:Uncharacterized protein n=1 Tax=Pyrus ussuriensis x Pyrus communis TaxID=2448454 RepID=A0A5N5HH13_9ROSA|nr:hypothetical protein D8674_020917 [Pyrus ussuriensis x Pyrus communis]